MKSRAKIVVAGLIALLSAKVPAASPSAMVLSVQGEVVVESPGAAIPVEPFLRLLAGDRIKLEREGRLRVVYPSTGREEVWSGTGVIVANGSASRIVAGQPLVAVRQLPARVAQQLARTPSADVGGKAGVVRMRAIQSPAKLEALDRYYAILRQEAAADDRMPELYRLAGLFELGAFERLRVELARLETSYPDDPSIRVAIKLYTRAMHNAEQAARP